MNRLQSEEVKRLPQDHTNRQTTTNSSHENGNTHQQDDDDDIFLKDEPADDDQARIRRRAPTRHSIKSLTGRKSLGKQTSNAEVKEKLRHRIFFASFCIFTFEKKEIFLKIFYHVA